MTGTAALTTRHQSDKLDLNDMGYINNPDHYAVQGWVERDFNSDDEERFFNEGNVHVRVLPELDLRRPCVHGPGEPVTGRSGPTRAVTTS